MCYNENVSLISFLSGTISSGVLYRYNPTLALMFLWVTCMQLFDFVFWKNQRKNVVNTITTKIAMFFNILQPVILAILIFYVAKKKLHWISLLLLVIYCVAAIIYICYWWSEIDYTLVTSETAPSLNWLWNNMPGSVLVYGLYIAALISLLWLHFSWPLNALLIIVIMGTFVFSHWYYKGQTVGRLWCYFAGFIPLVFVGLYLSGVVQ